MEQEYIDLGLPSGTLWAKCNVGARSEEEYGDYFTFDEAIKHYNLPSKEQINELIKECTWKWCTVNNSNGYLVTGQNNNTIFLPTAGYRYDSSLYSAGSRGYYWSSSLGPDCSDYACGLYFDSSNVYMDYGSRCGGRSLRQVKTN